MFFQRDFVHLPRPIRAILTESRHRNLAVIAAVRRPAEIPVALRSLVSKLAVFQLSHERDLDALSDILGADADPAIRELTRGQFFHFTV